MTNYEKIRSMSVEEMAEMLAEITDICVRGSCMECPVYGRHLCDKWGMKDWLNMEAEE